MGKNGCYIEEAAYEELRPELESSAEDFETTYQAIRYLLADVAFDVLKLGQGIPENPSVRENVTAVTLFLRDAAANATERKGDTSSASQLRKVETAGECIGEIKLPDEAASEIMRRILALKRNRRNPKHTWSTFVSLN